MVLTLIQCIPNLAFRCKSVLMIALMFASVASSATSKNIVDKADTLDWKRFSSFMKNEKRNDEIYGWSYILSGSLATIGGVVGYYSTQDPFAKAVYAVAQSLGIAAVGYGGAQIVVGNPHRPFYEAIDHTPSLTDKQRTEILQSYLGYKREERNKSDLIRAITHGLVAALNGINASREQNKDLKSALYFIGGINLLAAVSYTF